MAMYMDGDGNNYSIYELGRSIGELTSTIEDLTHRISKLEDGISVLEDGTIKEIRDDVIRLAAKVDSYSIRVDTLFSQQLKELNEKGIKLSEEKRNISVMHFLVTFIGSIGASIGAVLLLVHLIGGI